VGVAVHAPGPFATGRGRVTVTAGTSWSASDTYLVLGAGVGYFLFDGFEIGLDYEAWVAGTPVLNRLSPEARYVFYMVPTVKPYVGVFYVHDFVGSGLPDFDQLGARAGINIVPNNSRLWAGVGIVYEGILDCKGLDRIDCNAVYPEAFMGFSF
jgi:hypothetical protein